uniref:Uncharacterized protein n=1 Tax=Tetranychus urticae TaxID=32264 RepID=T1KHR5_TETUR
MIFLNRKVFILTFCLIGCTIHLFHVVNEFLKFPVQTDIIYDYPEKMIVPEIDIILYNIDLLNMTALYLKYPEKMENACEFLMKSANLENNSSVDCIKFLKSYYERSYHVGNMLTVGDVEQLNTESLIVNKSNVADFIRNDLCTAKKYFSAMNTFIRVSCREDSKAIERTLVRNIMPGNRFCIQHNIYHLFGVRFAHQNSSIDSYVFNYLEVEREAGESLFTFLRYRETTIESSEWPYQTNCRHYKKEDIFSQCLREKISHAYPGVVEFEDVIQVGQFPSHFKFEDLKTRTNETLSLIQSECTELVKQPQCIEKTYQTRGRSLKEKGSGIGLICLDNLIDFNIILKTYPKSTFTELLIYISSILGIWFGISIYGKLIDGFVFPTIATQMSGAITSKVGPGVEISTMTEEHETV